MFLISFFFFHLLWVCNRAKSDYILHQQQKPPDVRNIGLQIKGFFRGLNLWAISQKTNFLAEVWASAILKLSNL
jgi:hypothetical protein